MSSPCEASLPVCASIPHPMVNLFVYRCPHRGQWVAWWTFGTTDEPRVDPPVTWGPFDSSADVIASIAGQLAVGLAVLIMPDEAPST